MMSRLFLLTLSLLITCISPIAHAEIYRWVDKNGKTQFSDRPLRGKASNQIDVDTSKNSYGGGTVLNRQRDLLDRYKNEDLQSKKAKQQAKVDQEKREEFQAVCIRAKDKLLNFERSSIYTLNDEGERVYYSEEKRERRIEELRQTITKYCQ
jgi:hypothetical protein